MKDRFWVYMAWVVVLFGLLALTAFLAGYLGVARVLVFSAIIAAVLGVFRKRVVGENEDMQPPTR